MAFKNPWGSGSRNYDRWIDNPWSEGGKHHSDFSELTERLQDKVFGDDKKEVGITKNENGEYVVSGASGDALTILRTMVLTPEGAKQAIRLVQMKDEVRFALTAEIMTATNPASGQVEKVHAETQAFDKNDVLIRESESFADFRYWKITISSSETYETDRMKGWTDEEKICIVGSHETGHIGRIGYADIDHEKMIAYGNEIRCRFQYSELYPSKSTPLPDWINNYNRSSFFGVSKVNKYYKDAIDELVEAGKMTKETGDAKKTEFLTTNTGQ